MKILAVAAAAMVAGMTAGYLVCAALFRRAQKKARTRRTGPAKRETQKKIGVMDKVLVLEAVILLAYTVADMVVFWHTGSEPYTLTGCVFGVCGIENGVMGWIKTNKDRNVLGAGGNQDTPQGPPEGGAVG